MIGSRIAKEMKVRGWSEGELARRSGVNQPTIHRIITGESKNPRRDNVEKVAKALGISVEWLWSGNPRLAPSSAADAASPLQESQESEYPCTPHENATGTELAEADAESIVDLCDDQVAELLGKLRAAKKKASPRSQAVISRMIGLAERAALDDAAWKLIDDLLTELSKK